MTAWTIVAIVLVLFSVILAVMDRSFLSPMYLVLLAIFVVLWAGAKSPW